MSYFSIFYNKDLLSEIPPNLYINLLLNAQQEKEEHYTPSEAIFSHFLLSKLNRSQLFKYSLLLFIPPST